jgi:hypothetical protein
MQMVRANTRCKRAQISGVFLIRRFSVELADYPTMPLIIPATTISTVMIMPQKIDISEIALARATASREILP